MATLYVQEPWFSLIERGEKTVEGRAKSSSAGKQYVGGEIDIVCDEGSGVKVCKKICTEMRWYPNLEEYLRVEWRKAAPHAESMTDAMEKYLQVLMERDGESVQVFSAERVLARGGICALELA